MFEHSNQDQKNSGQDSSSGYDVPSGPSGFPPSPSSARPTPYGSPPSYNHPAYQQSFASGPPPAQAVPLPLGQACAQLPRQYLKVFTKPSAATFAQEMGKASWGIVWIQLLGFAFFSGLMFALLGFALLEEPTFLAGRGTRLSTLDPYLDVLAVALIAFVLVFAFFFLHTGLFYFFAKRAGGQGTFLAHSYTTLLFLVPSGILVEVLTFSSFVPVFAWPFLLAWPAWLMYCTVLEILVIKAVHRLSAGKSTVVVLIPPVVVVVVFMIVGTSIPSLAREAQTDIARLLGSVTGTLGIAFLVIMFILSWTRKVQVSKQQGRRMAIPLMRGDWQPQPLSTQAQPAPSSTPQQTAEQWLHEGLTHHRAGRYREALAAYDRMLQLVPHSAGAYYQKGHLLFDLGRYEEAIGAFDRAIQLAPTVTDAYHAKVQALRRLGRSTEAQQVYERVRQCGSPGDAELVCPRCGSTTVAPIVYGIPTPALMPLFLEGKIVAGGAMGRLLSGQAPTWQCRRCHAQWRGELFAGRSGDSIEHAVIIRGITSSAVGIRAEKQYLTEHFGLEQGVAAPQPGWRLEHQTLLQHAGCFFDVLTITLPDRTQQSVIFDITNFFGKTP